MQAILVAVGEVVSMLDNKHDGCAENAVYTTCVYFTWMKKLVECGGIGPPMSQIGVTNNLAQIPPPPHNK